MYKRTLLALIGVFAAMVGLFAWYLYAHWSSIVILDPAGVIGVAERNVILITLLLCSIVIIPVFIMLFSFAWLYRFDHPESHHHYFPDWDHHTTAAEVIWWVVPSAIIAILAVLAWKSSHELDPYVPLPGNAITVQVVALDWKWLFIYPEQGIASVNLLEIPANTPIHFELTADAPMNSFWIPSLGGQIMVMPGMTTQLNLEANRTGTFNGFSGNISGDGFAGMAFTTRAVPMDAFNAWVQSAKGSDDPLTSSTYATLASPSEYNPVALYYPVDPQLYTSVMKSYTSPEAAMQMGGMTMP